MITLSLKWKLKRMVDFKTVGLHTLDVQKETYITNVMVYILFHLPCPPPYSRDIKEESCLQHSKWPSSHTKQRVIDW